MSDRTVHAACEDFEVVRYDRAGKWYIEPTDPVRRRKAVAIASAVDHANRAVQAGGRVWLGLAGGTRFDSLICFPAADGSEQST